MNNHIVEDVNAVAAMAYKLLSYGVSVFKAKLIRKTGQYLVSWELEDEGLYNLEGNKQPDGRDNSDRTAGDHTA